MLLELAANVTNGKGSIVPHRREVQQLQWCNVAGSTHRLQTGYYKYQYRDHLAADCGVLHRLTNDSPNTFFKCEVHLFRCGCFWVQVTGALVWPPFLPAPSSLPLL